MIHFPLIERCEKCGKAFMDKSEVERHKTYEHIIPVSPFETTTVSKNITNSSSDKIVILLVQKNHKS